MESESSGRGWTDDRWDAPGGPASPVPGPEVSKQSGPRLSSASLVYGLAAARPVAGRGYATCHAQLEGPRESWRAPPRPAPPRQGGKAPPFPDRPAKAGTLHPSRPALLGWGAPSSSLGVSEGWFPHTASRVPAISLRAARD
uniref:Uncharacterized protein n=1 Tax=Molossus molossus TaxID=27622 RepID=A0A7J8CZ05_MOLMO|nr:hypothetical protein HJG59_009455 [Molossus molossus]